MKGSAGLDITLLFLPPLSLGFFVVAHVAIVARLFGQSPRWRAGAALVVPPLALFWGAQARMRGWCGLWLGSLLMYALTLVLAFMS